jgi:hypothetical protein
MRPTILKLLRQEPVSRAEWHELFWSVHMVCLWDEKSHAKMYKALHEDILEFIKQAQMVLRLYLLLLLYILLIIFLFQRVLTHEEDQSLLRAYISEWRKFFTQFKGENKCACRLVQCNKAGQLDNLSCKLLKENKESSSIAVFKISNIVGSW